MKKQLLTIVALLFAAITAMAQVELGAPKWNIKDGAKVSLMKVITLSFPNVIGDGLTAESSLFVAGNVVVAGGEANDDNAFDTEVGINDAVEIALSDYDVQEKTTYTIIINSVQIDSQEQLGDGETLSISFTTRGAERQLSWTFSIDEESVNKIKADDGNVSGGEGEYWKVVGVDTRHYVHKSLNNEEIMLDANTPLPMTEGLNFTFGADKAYVGDVVTTTYKNNLVFNGGNMKLIVPDCKTGDMVTITGFWASKNKAVIYVKNAVAKCINDGALVSTSQGGDGDADSIRLTGSSTGYKFEVKQDGDIEFVIENTRLTSVVIDEAKPIVDVNYSVVAVAEDDETKVLKTYVEPTVGQTNDMVKVYYSYWLKDEEGNLYTYGTKGEPFAVTYYLGSNDTTYVIKYKKTDITDVVYISEGEDFFDEEAQERTIEMVTQGNSAIRSSNGKAAYATADTKITTLPAGTYTFKAIIFDNTGKSSGFIQSIGISENTDEDLLLAANADNWTEAQETFVLENESDIIWRTGGNANKGIDIMVIYKADGGDAVASVEAAETAAPATRKVVKDGKFLIETANGTFTAAGAQVK